MSRRVDVSYFPARARPKARRHWRRQVCSVKPASVVLVSLVPGLEDAPGPVLDPGLDPSARTPFAQHIEQPRPSATVGGLARPANGIGDAGSGAAGMSGGLPLGGLQQPNRRRSLPS